MTTTWKIGYTVAWIGAGFGMVALSAGNIPLALAGVVVALAGGGTAFWSLLQ